jgi:hypothetical protein
MCISWVLCFSLLARIALISSERTPHHELLQTSRNRALPGDARESSLLIKTEDVKIDEANIQKIMMNKHVSYTRLPPPAAVSEPDHTPTGLFSDVQNKKTQKSRQRRTTLNHHIMHPRKEVDQTCPLQPVKKGGRESVVITTDGRGTASLGSTQSQTSKNLLSAVRTTNLSTNFRNAQALLYAIRKKNGQLDTKNEDSLLEEEEEEYDEDEEEEFTDDESEESMYSNEDVDFCFMEMMQAQKQQRSPKFHPADVNDREDEKTVYDPAVMKNYSLYADMMNEAESIDLLRRGSVVVKRGVMASLTAKKDKRRELGKWKETKAEEQKVYEENIKKNEAYINEVIRMYHLREQMNPAENMDNATSKKTPLESRDFSIRWQEVLAKNKEGRKNEIMTVQKDINASEKKILTMLKVHEIKQDTVSLHRHDRA